MSDYVPTNWVEGGAPGISAANLQKMEAGIDTAHSELQAHIDGHLASIINAVYPVGSLYLNATNPANPGALLGIGTWVAFGTGRVLVGIDAGQTEFDTAGETGGAKTHTLTQGEMPSHNHDMGTVNLRAAVADYTAGVTDLGDIPGSNVPANAPDVKVGSYWSGALGNTGGSAAHNNLQPYIVVYMWRRTA